MVSAFWSYPIFLATLVALTRWGRVLIQAQLRGFQTFTIFFDTSKHLPFFLIQAQLRGFQTFLKLRLYGISFLELSHIFSYTSSTDTMGQSFDTSIASRLSNIDLYHFFLNIIAFPHLLAFLAFLLFGICFRISRQE